MNEMNSAMPTIRAFVAAACLVCGAGLSHADAPGDARPPMDGGREPHAFGPDWAPHAFGPAGAHDPNLLGELPPPPYLHGIKLSEEQGDKIFALLHAASPKFRDQAKTAHKAREALRELGESAAFDDAKAQSLSQALASSEGQLSLLHTRLNHEIFLTLTPEQRTQIADRKRPDGDGAFHHKGPAAP
jgi:Spy/CpxP family protein refolding chaperone